MDEETTSFKRTIMDEEELAFAALKVILNVIDKPIIFFVDELESLFIALGPEAELQFLENLKKMYNEASNFILCLACLATLWDKILDLSSTAVQSRIEPPVVLKRFRKKDIQNYCNQMLQDFHQKFEILPSDQKSLWPLGKADIESAYAYSHGNPREAIKWLAGCIEERKGPLLKNLKKNQEFLTRTGKAIKVLADQKKDFSTGILQKNHGAFISLSSSEKRILVTVPPLESMDEVFHNSYKSGLKSIMTTEKYDEIILIGSHLENEIEDLIVIQFSIEELDTKFQEFLDQF